VWHIIVVVAAVVVATIGTAASVSATEPEETAATVDTCDGGTMRLDAKEARTSNCTTKNARARVEGHSAFT
jgi:hypothetical protein